MKKMCVLHQVKNGFSQDGKPLSGLVKTESYGKNLSVEVSIIGLAPPEKGEYYCLVADKQNHTFFTPLRGKSLFNVVSDIDISDGFCAILLYVKEDVSVIAYGVNGTEDYDFSALVEGATAPKQQTEIATTKEYNDELVASTNYYKEQPYDDDSQNETNENEDTSSGNTDGGTEERQDFGENENATDILQSQPPDDYYAGLKREIDALFSAYPNADDLVSAFPSSEWIRIEKNDKQVLVGILYDDETVKYIAYALPTTSSTPPPEIENSCVFVPKTPFDKNDGYFVIFQSAKTGECVPPKKP